MQKGYHTEPHTTTAPPLAQGTRGRGRCGYQARQPHQTRQARDGAPPPLPPQRAHCCEYPFACWQVRSGECACGVCDEQWGDEALIDAAPVQTQTPPTNPSTKRPTCHGAPRSPFGPIKRLARPPPAQWERVCARCVDVRWMLSCWMGRPGRPPRPSDSHRIGQGKAASGASPPILILFSQRPA